ncbi:DUF3298 domain-containing protein [Mycolicibacterium thermoresistibile]
MLFRRTGRWLGAVLMVSGLTLTTAAVAGAEPQSAGTSYTVVPAVLAGGSPNGLGDWTVSYEKLGGGDAAITGAINQILDDEADGQVWQYVAASSRTTPWTFHTQGRLLFRPVTISALFLGRYEAPELPNMPIDTVATRVFDGRSGIQIVWDNLFTDRQEGLNRLSTATKQLLPATYPTPPAGGWAEYGHAMAPIPLNFKFWIPTATGIELHFPEGQFGRERRSITVGWDVVREVIAPEFQVITE